MKEMRSKKAFEAPVCTVVLFGTDDIITSSQPSLLGGGFIGEWDTSFPDKNK